MGPSIQRKIRRDNVGKGQLAAVSDDKLQGPVGLGTTEVDRSVLVWRMSSYER
jgi:hypothetical protein